jgi:undecaprenyl-diphosphatase
VTDSSTVARFDAAVDELFDRLRGVPALDRMFYTASELGDWSLLWHLLGASQGVLLCNGLERAVRLSACMGLESAIVNGGVKSIFRRSRPAVEGERPHNLRQPRTSSFPSGHASAAFVAAALLSEGTRAKPLFYGIAAVVASSRVHVRIHHASDVVGGVAVGIVLGEVAKRLWPLGTPPRGLRELLDR